MTDLNASLWPSAVPELRQAQKRHNNAVSGEKTAHLRTFQRSVTQQLHIENENRCRLGQQPVYVGFND